MSTQTTSSPAVELAGLTKRFGRTLAVDNLSLSIARGSTFGLIGPNGAGKSTTIKMMIGVLSPTAGSARALGLDVAADHLQVKQCVGYVPEVHNVCRWMRIEEAIAFCRSVYDSWNDETCRELLQRFRLDPRKKVKHLSKGTRVKLSLLLAVSHEPELLLLDEPMAGLDPVAREEFLDGVLRTICERGQTVLFSTHTLDDVQRLADTVGILYDGRLLLESKIDELLANTKRVRATLRDGSSPEFVPPGVIWQRVQGREWLVTLGDFSLDAVSQLREKNRVDHVEVIDLGLEDLFKDIVKGQRAAP